MKRAIWLTVRRYAAVLVMIFTWPSVAAAHFAYVSNDVSGNVTVIDTTSNSVVATIDVSPYHVQNAVVSPNGSFAYFAGCCATNGAVIVVDTSTNAVAATIPLPSGVQPYGIAITPDGSRVYVSDFSGTDLHHIYAIDTATNAVAGSIAVGTSPHGIAITANGASAYIANAADNTVTVVDLTTNATAATIPVGQLPHAVAIAPNGLFAYVANYDDGSISVIDTPSNTVVTTILTGSNDVEGITFGRDGSHAYVCHQHSNFLSIIDTATSTVVGTITVGGQPFQSALTPDGGFLYVANQTTADVSVVDTSSNGVVATVATAPGSSPVGVAIRSTSTSVSATYYLVGAAHLLDTTAPAGSTPRTADSAGVNIKNGNPWKTVGTWTGSAPTATGLLTMLNDSHVWLGLKNSDDVGTNFDLRVEVRKNSAAVVGAGEAYCVQGLVRSASLAKEVVVSFGATTPTTFNGLSDQISLTVLTRVGTDGSGHSCGGHSSAVGLRLYYDSSDNQSRFQALFQP